MDEAEKRRRFHASREMVEQGTFGFAADAAGFAEFEAIFRKYPAP